MPVTPVFTEPVIQVALPFNLGGPGLVPVADNSAFGTGAGIDSERHLVLPSDQTKATFGFTLLANPGLDGHITIRIENDFGFPELVLFDHDYFAADPQQHFVFDVTGPYPDGGGVWPAGSLISIIPFYITPPGVGPAFNWIVPDSMLIQGGIPTPIYDCVG